MTTLDLDCALVTLRATTVRLLSSGMLQSNPIIVDLVCLTAELLEIRQELREYELDEALEKVNAAKRITLDKEKNVQYTRPVERVESLQADGNGESSPSNPLDSHPLPSTCEDSDSDWED